VGLPARAAQLLGDIRMGRRLFGTRKDLPETADWPRLRELFIALLHRRPKAEIDLWPSQVEAARHPERYAGVVLTAGMPYWRPEPGGLDWIRDVVRGRSPQQFNTLAFSPSTPMDVMREAWMEQVKTDPRVLYGDFLAGAAFDGRPLLERIRIPTLVIHGADDRIVGRESAEAVASAIAGARLEILPLAGHIPQLEQGERFNELLETFAGALR
jgi:pimeloyl-ACP methyl ester carboxylesterase